MNIYTKIYLALGFFISIKFVYMGVYVYMMTDWFDFLFRKEKVKENLYDK